MRESIANELKLSKKDKKVRFSGTNLPSAPRVEELDNDGKPLPKEIGVNYAAVEEIDGSRKDTAVFVDVAMYTVAYTADGERRTTRGVRTSLKTFEGAKDGDWCCGILTSRHLFPTLTSIEIENITLSVTIDGTTHEWKGDKKYTQLVTCSHSCSVCNSQTLPERIAGADAILIVDSRANKGSAFRMMEPVDDHAFYLLSDPKYARIASQCLYDSFARSGDVCPGLYPLTGFTAKNEGDSGLPVFQFVNNTLRLVGINKGIDPRWKSVRHSLIQTGINLNWTRHLVCSGSEVTKGILALRYQQSGPRKENPHKPPSPLV
jgi:hypothetical protein